LVAVDKQGRHFCPHRTPGLFALALARHSLARRSVTKRIDSRGVKVSLGPLALAQVSGRGRSGRRSYIGVGADSQLVDRCVTLGLDIQPKLFDITGVVVVSYALFAFMLGVTLGAIIQRPAWAFAASVPVFGFIRLVLVDCDQRSRRLPR